MSTLSAVQLKGGLEEELANNRSIHGWKGTGVTIRRDQFSLTPSLRAQAQNIGRKNGCHTCGTRIEVDEDQPWIGDHIPPTELSYRARRALKTSDTTVLFPQCDRCASTQSSLVKQLNGKSDKVLKEFEWADGEVALIYGGKLVIPSLCVNSSGPKVSGGEGAQIQALGLAQGCHSCGADYPRSIYHADHTFPQEFCTSYMEQVFQKLGLAYPAAFELRPQCPKCSGAQGGQVSKLMFEALNFASKSGVDVYKDVMFEIGRR